MIEDHSQYVWSDFKCMLINQNLKYPVNRAINFPGMLIVTFRVKDY